VVPNVGDKQVSQRAWRSPVVQGISSMDTSQRKQNKNRPPPPLAVCLKCQFLTKNILVISRFKL